MRKNSADESDIPRFKTSASNVQRRNRNLSHEFQYQSFHTSSASHQPSYNIPCFGEISP
ncbi:hypothetical protein [Nostoc sp.]|uniref:hypothetical protein n=1 Tax=Nostoc sp. TaxID=1180 RepID=UPI002FF8A39B